MLINTRSMQVRINALFKVNKVKMAKSTTFFQQLFYKLFSQLAKLVNVTSDCLFHFPEAILHDCLQSKEAGRIQDT